MHIRTRSGVIAAGFLTAAALVAGGGALAGPASAAPLSSTNCVFTNGCATLKGVDANGSAVALDAKHQSKTEILIGYADNAGDDATSFDGDLHYGKGAKVTSYADTGLTVKDFDNTCHPSHNDVAPTVSYNTPPAAGTITASGNDLSVSTSATNLTTSGGETSTLSWTADAGMPTHTSTLVVAETYGAGCVALWGTDVTTSGGVASFIPFSAIPGNNGGRIHEENTGSSVDTFTDTAPGGTFTFTALPAGVSQSGGVLTADTSTAIPGTYTSVGVVYTEPGGVIDTASFTLVITGIKSSTPGAGVPYYTFVFAPNGDWTSQCVTDINGSGALRLEPCTLGKDTGQDFTIGATTPGLLSSSQAPVRNLLAEATSPADSYLTDPSTSNPATPQSEVNDELTPGGRELYVNGPDTSVWSWST